MKILKYILMWLFILGYLAVILGFIGREQNKATCTGARIIIHDSLKLQFVNSAMIMRILHRGGVKLTGQPLGELDLEEMEREILLVRAIRKAEVYVTVNGEVVAEIFQRKPVVRIIDRYGQGFYIDEEGYIIPVSRNFCPYVIVVNGNISEHYRRLLNIEEPGRENDLLRGIFSLVSYINSDDFWEAQIVQVYVNGDGEFELIPRAGAQIIEFGSVDEMDKKFEKLWILYNEGFRATGWNQYNRINLKYENQVVCTKR